MTYITVKSFRAYALLLSNSGTGGISLASIFHSVLLFAMFPLKLKLTLIITGTVFHKRHEHLQSLKSDLL